MKVLVRADTHVTFTVPDTEPRPKCTFSQVLKVFETLLETENNFWFSFQLLAAVATSWVSMIIGYSTAFTSPAQASLEKEFSLKDVEVSPQFFKACCCTDMITLDLASTYHSIISIFVSITFHFQSFTRVKTYA